MEGVRSVRTILSSSKIDFRNIIEEDSLQFLWDLGMEGTISLPDNLQTDPIAVCETKFETKKHEIDFTVMLTAITYIELDESIISKDEEFIFNFCREISVEETRKKLLDLIKVHLNDSLEIIQEHSTLDE